MITRKPASKLLALGAAVALTAAACGSDDADTIDETPVETDAVEDDGAADATEEDGDTEDAATEEDGDTEEDGAMEDDAAMAEDALEPSGDLCEAVPADGDGSFAGMTDDPAATAASNNPALSTLVAAVTEAGLVDTLNGDGPFTIFAPANPAFEALPEGTLDAVLADQELLTSILTLHVVAGEQLSSADLAEMDSVETLNGDITLEVTDAGLLVNGQATVGCADVQTANATVHIIDAVLMPAADDDAAMEEDGGDTDGDTEDGGEGEEG